jgi:hypothetical protein
MHRNMVRWSNINLNSLSGGLLVSLLLHGLIVAVLLFDLPEPMAEAEPEEEVVAVTIVPPPEPEAAPEPEPEAAPEAEEPAPEPEAPEPETPAEPEPEPEQAEETPPVPAGPDSEGEGGAVPIQVMRPVFQFGEEAAGPEVALDGGAAQAPEQDQPEAPAAEPELETAAEIPPGDESRDADLADDPAEEVAEELAEAPVEQPAQQDAPAPAMPAEVTPPDEVLAGDAPGNLPDATGQAELALLPDDPADPAPSAPEPVVPDPVEIPPPASATRAPSAAPADTAPAVDNGLPGVRALSSIVDTGHAVATTAMGALPREERGSRLCTTELREQLRRAPEPYRVELLPAYRLPGGTVLNVPNAAFRAGGAWYNLSFRCTVDRDALRVTDFTFKVGTAIPRQDWRARGFPEF